MERSNLEFREIQLADKPLLMEYLGKWSMDNAEHSFANLFMWRKAYNIKFCEKDDVLFLRFRHEYGSAHPILFSPLPKNEDMDYCKVMEETIQYCKDNDFPFKLQSVVEKMVEYIRMNCKDIFTITLDRDYSEYVYNMDDLVNLVGKKYHKKRNHINRFLEYYPNHEYAPITADDIDECKAMYRQWRAAREAEGMEDLDLEEYALCEGLDNMAVLNLDGGLVRVDGKVEAFTLGERISDKTALIHIEKANQEIQGLYPFINREFLKANYTDLQFVNREEDMGLEGLRRAKESYYPAFLIHKYMVTLKEDGVDGNSEA
ncbi:phosphatidylglycerol lysyltransferase domain-containing protein [Eubacteriales bacterium OttesenSCG-928-M02]|nr:phosphatidylglycerol lysyltransferase domain-containing protein [Eubacteriales bacterium OttesenSCG-928-M02]